MLNEFLGEIKLNRSDKTLREERVLFSLSIFLELLFEGLSY